MDVCEAALVLAEGPLIDERRANEFRRMDLPQVSLPLNSISIGIELLDRHCSKDEEVLFLFSYYLIVTYLDHPFVVNFRRRKP